MYAMFLHLYFVVKQSIAEYMYYSFWLASASQRLPPPAEANYVISRLSRMSVMVASPFRAGICPLEHP
jgi:hypothetical protein